MSNFFSGFFHDIGAMYRIGLSSNKPNLPPPQTAHPSATNQGKDWDDFFNETSTEPTTVTTTSDPAQDSANTDPVDLYPELRSVKNPKGAAANGFLGATGDDSGLLNRSSEQAAKTAAKPLPSNADPAEQPPIATPDPGPAEPPASVPEADPVEPEPTPAQNAGESAPPVAAEPVVAEDAQPTDSPDSADAAESVANTEPELAEGEPIFIPNPSFQNTGGDGQVLTRPLYKAVSIPKNDASFSSEIIDARLRDYVKAGKSTNGCLLPEMTFILFDYEGEQLRIDELLEKEPSAAPGWYKQIPHKVYQVIGVLPDGNIRFVEEEDKDFARDYESLFWRSTRKFIEDSRNGANLNNARLADPKTIVNSVRATESNDSVDATATRYVGPGKAPSVKPKKNPSSDAFGAKAGRRLF